MAYSSSKKVQHFETPINLDRSLSRFAKKSAAKYMVEEQKAGEEKADSASDAQRRIMGNSMNNSIANA